MTRTLARFSLLAVTVVVSLPPFLCSRTTTGGVLSIVTESKSITSFRERATPCC